MKINDKMIQQAVQPNFKVRDIIRFNKPGSFDYEYYLIGEWKGLSLSYYAINLETGEQFKEAYGHGGTLGKLTKAMCSVGICRVVTENAELILNDLEDEVEIPKIPTNTVEC